MSLELIAINKNFGAYASGINITEDIGEQEKIEIEAAMDKFAVLIWQNCPLEDERQIKLAENFGQIEVSLLSKVRGKGGPANKSLVPISNVADDGDLLDRDGRRLGSQVANQFWHSDSSFMQHVAKYSLLSAREVPKEGGNTEFADLRAAYDELPDSSKTMVEGLIAEHHVFHSRITLGLKYTPEEISASPPAHWPLVRVHPSSKRKVIFPPVHIRAIKGMSDPEARLLVNELIEHATQKHFCFAHKWSRGDLVMWDNRVTLHRGRRYDLGEKRVLRRITTMETNGD